MPTLPQIDRWEELESKRVSLNKALGQIEPSDGTDAKALQAELTAIDEELAELTDKKKWKKHHYKCR